jgi:hypothetical protein
MFVGLPFTNSCAGAGQGLLMLPQLLYYSCINPSDFFVARIEKILSIAGYERAQFMLFCIDYVAHIFRFCPASIRLSKTNV